MKDNDFIQELYVMYSEKIYKYLLTQGKTPEEAEDILHNVFLIAILRIDVLRQSPNKCGWLYNTAKNYIKKDWANILKNQQLIAFMSEKLRTPMPEDRTNEIFDIVKPLLSDAEYKYIHDKFILDKSNAQMALEQDKTTTAMTSFGSRIYHKIRKGLKDEFR